MAKEPEDRYQTMAALRDDLKAAMRKLSRETGVVPTEASATLLLPQRARTSWLLASTLGRVLPRRVLGRLRTPLREARSGPQEAAGSHRGPAPLERRRPLPPVARRPPLQERRPRPRSLLLRVRPGRRPHHRAGPGALAGGAALHLHRVLRGPERRPAAGGRGAGGLGRPAGQLHPGRRSGSG